MNNIKTSIICILIFFSGSFLSGQTSDDELVKAHELYEKGEYQLVVDILRPIDKDINEGEIKMLMGDAEHKMEYFDMAIRYYNEAEKAGLKTVDLYFHRGAAYISIGNYNKATKDLSKAIEIEPENAELYFYR